MADFDAGSLDPRVLDPLWFGETFVKIRTKEQKELPFLFNGVQRSWINRATEPRTPIGYTDSSGEEPKFRVLKRGLRDLILKGRQHGFTTLIIEAFLHDTITNPSTNTSIIAHRKEASEEILNAIRFMYNSIPEWQPKPRIGRDNKGVIEFPDLGSKISVGVVGPGSVRSGTIHNLLCTEVAFWGQLQGTMAAALEAVPMNGNVVAETTPNGVGGWYYSKVVETRGGGSSWRLFEYPWFLNKKYAFPREMWRGLGSKIKLNKNGGLEPYTADEIELITTYKIRAEQIAWRRWKIGESDVRTFAQEYECDFLQSGRPVFLKDYVYNDPRTGHRRVLVRGKEGGLQVLRPFVPGRKYLLGSDVAEGLESGDYDVSTVIDYETGQECAKLRGHFPLDVYAERIVDLAELYGWPIIGIERNNHGHGCILRVRQILQEKKKLSRLYYAPDGRWGWPTLALSKAMMVKDLEEGLRKGRIHPQDQNTIDELIAFEYKANGTTGAPEGVHDDSVIALGIAAQMLRFHINDDDEESDDSDEIGVRIIS